MTSHQYASCPTRADFDPLSPTFLADPFAVLASVWNEAPVFYASSIGYYVVTRYADIEAVFLDHETYSAAITQLPLVPLEPAAASILSSGGTAPQSSMVSLDPPAHSRLRAPTVRAFTPQRVARMEPRIRSILNQLLNAIDPSAPFDLVAALTFPLPATVIFSFLGVPERDWHRLKQWCGHRANLTFGRPTPPEQIHHSENMAAYRSYLRSFVESKALEADHSFTSALLEIQAKEPDKLTREEIVSILYSLTFAGHETTNYLIGNMVCRLLEDSERWAAVVTDPGLIAGAVDEVLRYDTSVPIWRRVTTRSTKLGGVEVPVGAKLLLWLAAAGRDSDIFPEPEKFDLARNSASKTLAFGKGIHYCLGAALGKLEAQLALEALTRHFPRLRLVDDQILEFRPNFSFRGPEALWVTAA